MVWVAEGWGKERRRKPRDKRHMAAMVVPLSHWSVRLHGSHHPFNCRERKKVCLLHCNTRNTTKATAQSVAIHLSISCICDPPLVHPSHSVH